MISYEIPKGIDSNTVILVGEAPGEKEVSLNRPFVGKTGKLLDLSLKRFSIERGTNQVAIFNTFRIRPENNEIKRFFLSQKQALKRNVSIDYSFSSSPFGYLKSKYRKELVYLRNSLNLYSPTVIVAMGKVSSWAIGNLYGKISLPRLGLPINVGRTLIISTHHPTYALIYNKEAKKEFEKDLGKAFEWAESQRG
jgi:DNA polymerase